MENVMDRSTFVSRLIWRLLFHLMALVTTCSVATSDIVNYVNDYGMIDEKGQWTGSVRGIMDGVREM